MTDAPAIRIYHNPDCGTSRNVLALLQRAGAAPEVIDYLHRPPPGAEIMELATAIGLPLRAILRRKGTPYAAVGLDDPAIGTAALLAAVAAHPILLNRPIVAAAGGVRLCRPSDVVLDLLPQLPATRLCKEDGVPFLRDRPIAPDDRSLVTALAAGGLPVDDLAGPDKLFFAHHMLDGELAGHGGFEHHGEDALIRSLVVSPGLRGTGLGPAILALLMYRAFMAGARRAWLFTTAAAPFFAELGFTEADRASAPAAILDTGQARGVCPASATLMTRKLGF